MEKIKVMIAEDHPIYRSMLVQGLATENISIIGVAENGKVLINLVKENLPDVVILDLNMPIMDGHEVLEIFAKDFRSIRTIILSTDYAPFYLANAIIMGAAGYLSKSTDIPEVILAIEEAYKYGYHFNELISKEILEQLRDDKKKLYYIIEDKRLSKREIQVLTLLCDEVPIAQIADRLDISTNTVLHHKKKLFEKTDSETMVSLVRYAIRQGIIKDEKS